MAFDFGGLEGIRTLDPHPANVVRSQLRYKPMQHWSLYSDLQTVSRLSVQMFFGGLEGIRTLDPHPANVVRSQLRYKPMQHWSLYSDLQTVSRLSVQMFLCYNEKPFERSLTMNTIAQILSQELGQKQEYINNVIALIDEGNTIPFIARYRKERHGGMDDTTLRELETRLTYLRSLEQRRQEVKNAIENQGKLTQQLSEAIDQAATLTEVEDLYRPYKQKRRTRGTIAREKGLEPLAAAIFAQEGKDPLELAKDYVNQDKGPTSRSAAPGAPLPVRRGWSRWRRRSLPKRGRIRWNWRRIM